MKLAMKFMLALPVVAQYFISVALVNLFNLFTFKRNVEIQFEVQFLVKLGYYVIIFLKLHFYAISKSV